MDAKASTGVQAGDILVAFERRGLRSTRPRRLIADSLARLAAQQQDFSTEGLWKDLQSVDPSVGRATVFRAVDVLVDEGLLDRVTFADGSHRYRVCSPRHHHHLTCVRCQRIVEVDACLSQSVLDGIAAEEGFSIDGHSLELYGRCPACRDEVGRG